MKHLICALALVILPSAHAEELTCVFTRPYHTFRLDTEKRTISSVDAFTRRERTGRVLSVRRVDELEVYHLEIDGRHPTLGYVRDGKGSDGLSPDRYPYTGQLWDDTLYPQYGGCFTPAEPVNGR